MKTENPNLTASERRYKECAKSSIFFNITTMLHYRISAKHLLMEKVTLVSCSGLNTINVIHNNGFDYFMCEENDAS